MNSFESVTPLRIAFLTATFATEPDGGGIGAYLHRLTKVLHELGHEPEVFTLSQERPGVITFDKIRVERVGVPNNLPLRAIRRLSRLNPKLNISEHGDYVLGALGLARAFYVRDREQHFDLVQSSDYGLTGLFINKHPSRRHLMQCFWAADLFIRADGEFDKLRRLYCWLERYSIRKADVAYAPSEFVARYYKEEHGLQIEVLRPPVMLETEAGSTLPWDLPERYFMYFGAICSRKGTDVLAAALPTVWLKEPEFTMVWAGESWLGAIENYRRAWGEHASRVKWLGYIVAKTQLYAVLKRAEVVVIPSRVDNLPSTLIESLLLNVPIIGSLGASIDELVEPGTNGELVQIGDPQALAEAMLKAWRREVPWMNGRFRLPSIMNQMNPHVAAAKFLQLAGMPASRFQDA
jgi:glycosyltransferase involved in cell wall biosynthesis